MKTTFSVVAFLLSSTLASANSLPDFLKQFPAHQQEGFRDTGCDPDQQVQVDGTNYFNNPTCPKVKGSSDSVKAAAKAPKPDDGDGGDSDDNGGDTPDDGDDNGGPTNDDHGPSDDSNGGGTNDDTSDYNGGDTNDDTNGNNSDGNNGHGNDDDHDDDGNPGKGRK